MALNGGEHMTEVTRIGTGTEAPPGRVEPGRMYDAHYASLHAVEQVLTVDRELPKVVLFEREGVTTVYVSTLGRLEPGDRSDVGRAVRAALVPYTRLAPNAQVVFLTRGRP